MNAYLIPIWIFTWQNIRSQKKLHALDQSNLCLYVTRRRKKKVIQLQVENVDEQDRSKATDEACQ